MVLPDRDDGDGYDIAIKSTENMNENRRFFLIAGIMQPPN
jgi:hypothetical protein